MKIGKFFKFVIKTLAAAIAIGSIAYIVKDIMDKKASDNFDDTWDDDLDEDFDDMFENRCHRITHDDINNRSFWSRFMSVILRTIAPLL